MCWSISFWTSAIVQALRNQVLELLDRAQGRPCARGALNPQLCNRGCRLASRQPRGWMAAAPALARLATPAKLAIPIVNDQHIQHSSENPAVPSEHCPSIVV